MFQPTKSANEISELSSAAESTSSWRQTPFISLLIGGESTQGKVAVLEAVQRKGAEPPSHSHPETDEVFYVIEGKMTFTVAGETIPAPAGTAVFIERGKEHAMMVETETANTLILLLPAPPTTTQV